MRINTMLLFFTILFLSISRSWAVPDEPYLYRPADRGQFLGHPNQVQILPCQFLREYDPLTFFFTSEQKKGELGPEDNAEKYVSLSPEHPGEYIWIDAKTLEFRPTIAWPPVKQFTVKAGNKSKTLVTLLFPPKLLEPLPKAVDLDPVREITFSFSYAVAIPLLEKLVTFESRELPGVDPTRAALFTAADYTIKRGEQRNDGSVPYTFIFNQPFGLGKKVFAHILLSDQKNLSEGICTYTFETKTDFRLIRAGIYGNLLSIAAQGSHYAVDHALAMTGEQQVILEFTSALEKLSLSQVKSLINFSPSPQSFSFTQRARRIDITAKLAPQRLYKITLQPITIKDKLGRDLMMDRTSSFYCYRHPEKSSLRWGGASVFTVERFGVQQIPLNITNIHSFDLRIYRIDPLHKAFWPFPASPISLDERVLPPGPGEEPRLEKDIHYPLSTGEIGNHIRMLGSPHYSSVIDVHKQGIIQLQALDLEKKLATITGKGNPGTYIVGIRPLKGSTYRSYVKVQATDLCLSTVESGCRVQFIVTSYKTGKPVANANLYIEGIQQSKFKRFTEKTTDENGQCTITCGELYDSEKAPYLRRLVVCKDNDYLVIGTDRNYAPPRYANNHWQNNADGWLSCLTVEPYDCQPESKIKGFLFPERPIYRPGEKVYLKGYLRSRQAGVLKIIQKGDVEIKLTTPKETRHIPVTLNERGSISYEFQEEEQPTGIYHAALMYTADTDNSSWQELVSTSFKVEAYRIPRFEISLHGPDKVANDQSFTMAMTASYYAGGRVMDAETRWRITSYPYTWIPKQFEGFVFSSDSRYHSQRSSVEYGTRDEIMRTDDDGSALLVVKPDASIGGNPVKYVCEATVTDMEEQSVTDARTVLALPAFILGLKTDRYIHGGSTIKGLVTAIGVNNKPVAGKEIEATLKKMSWTSYLQETDFARSKPQYITEEQIHKISSKIIKSTSKPDEIVFEKCAPGVYLIELSSTDKLGRLQTLQLDVFLAGDKPVVWQKPEQQVFEAVVEETAYEPGETAQIILKSPYQNAMALAVVESPDGEPEYSWVRVQQGQASFALPITHEMIPRIPVSFLLMRPRISIPRRTPEGTTVDPGKPETVSNTTYITVKPVTNRITIDLVHDSVITPGDIMDINISLTEHQSAPLPGEVTLWLVDKAVLSLAREQNLDPVNHFIDPVSTKIYIRDTRNLAQGKLGDFENPGGGEGEEILDEGEAKITVRKNFKTVPYYNGEILIDKSGKASIRVPMPDNLTKFAIRAIAISGHQRFGLKKSQVFVRLPVIIQPSLPRFVRTGDLFKAGGIARIVEGEGGGAGLFSFTADGLSITSNKKSEKWHAFTFPGKQARPLYLDFEVITPGYDENGLLLKDSISLIMAVRKKSGKKGDAFQVAIPLRTDRAPITQMHMARVTADSAFSFLPIKQPARDNTLTRQLMVSNNLPLIKILSGLRYLMEYPHGCSEQKVSRAYPSLAYQEIWQQMGLKPFDPKLTDYINETIFYLQKTQNEDGLFGYWPGDPGRVYLTAYITEFLATVADYNKEHEHLYQLPQKMLDRALDALERSLRSDYDYFLSGYKYYERCAAIQALVMGGRTDMAYLKQMAYHSQETDVLSQSRIYWAMVKSGKPMKKILSDLETTLWNQTVFKLRQGKEVFGGLQSGSSRIGAEIHGSEINSLAGLVRAFSVKTSDTKKSTMLFQELVNFGHVSGWGNTHANGLALLALHDYLKEEKKGKKSVKLQFSLGAQQNTLIYNEKDRLLQHAFNSPEAGKVTIPRSTKIDSVYVKLFERWIPKAPGSEAAAQQKGFVVKRRLMLISDSGKPAKKRWIDKPGESYTFMKGDIIEEQVQVTNPENRHFVAVTIPLAAGLEYLNPELKTAAVEFTPSGKTSNKGSYQAYYDDHIAFYFNTMAAGTYNFYFRVRATTEGSFTKPPAQAEMMYAMEIRGNSPGARVIIKPEGEEEEKK